MAGFGVGEVRERDAKIAVEEVPNTDAMRKRSVRRLVLFVVSVHWFCEFC